MKRALKIIVPILMAIAVVLCIGWYFLKYDTDFTRDLLVNQARRFESSGNHRMATWFYDLAYRQSGEDETVALELADYYRSIGNYTKAEYTLSNAIADGGTVELYIDLCRTYVEQDKLLDAVTMLDNVSNPFIKMQLNQMRPKAPTASPEHGFYDKYINVALDSPDGTIYATTDGTYPSTKSNPYSTPLALNSGDTIIYALSVGENGLVSSMSILSYTITGVIEEVTLTDPAIDRVVRQYLQVDADHQLYSNELWTITALAVPGDAKSLDDLYRLPYLKQLSIRDTSFESLDPLWALTALEELVLSSVPVAPEDLEIIAKLPMLQSLTLEDCNLSDIIDLTASTGLTYLDLTGNTIGDLSAISSMTNLEYLDLSHNAVTDLSILKMLPKLVELDLSYNSISSVKQLRDCKSLAILNLSGNLLTDVNGLEALTELRSLSVANNKITDIQPLSNNTKLGDLDISSNLITDITSLNTLNELFSFNFSYNQVEKLPKFQKDCNLVVIKGTHNRISSLSRLSGLKNLNNVIMDFNENITSVSVLSTCSHLVEVSVYGAKVPIADATILIDMNVIVKYTPI